MPFECPQCQKMYNLEYNRDMHIKLICKSGVKENPVVINIKPPIKWIGGKTQIIKDIMKSIPNEMNNYHEVFLGGGSVLLSVLQYKNSGNINIKGNIYAYDYNKELINLYTNIQKYPTKIFKTVNSIYKEYKKCTGSVVNRKPVNITEATTSKESYYFWKRNEYNTLKDLKKNSILKSSLFIFLNKTCFRGMFREGPNGFNVPFGNYKNVSDIKKEEIISLSNLIKNVKFIHNDFQDSIANIKKDDFVYLDPPYAPKNSNSFVGYTKSGFTLEQHEKLFELCNNFKHNSISFTMSNANVDLVNEHFPDSQFNKNIIDARRAINSKNPGSKTTELIIMNH
jgi:DNA adenine methylase